MTARKNLKRRVRERQELTGERYTDALTQVRAGAPPGSTAKPFSVVELVCLTDEAARIGLRCDVRAFPDLLAKVEVPALLTRVRDTLIRADGDRRLRRMRRAALLGESVTAPPEHAGAGILPFFERARAGAEGPSDEGSLLGVKVDGADGPLIALVLLWCPFPGFAPRLVLSTVKGWIFAPLAPP